MRLARVVTLVAVVAAAASGAQAAQAPILVKGFASIGAFKVRGGGPIEAKKAFGKPVRQRDYGDSCTLSWTGLEISFYTLLDKPQCTDSAFGSAAITRPWVTDRGLKQGDLLSRAKHLYPDTGKKGSVTKTTVWLIRKFSPAIADYGLYAGLRNGRVSVLYIEDPQGGE